MKSAVVRGGFVSIRELEMPDRARKIPNGERTMLKSLSDKWFEMLLITVALGVTLLAHHLLNVAPVIVHFFYLPVIISAYYFGRNLACLTAVFSVLSVTAFALLDPVRYLSTVDTVMTLVLTLTVWAGFLGLNAILVGTLCDQRAAQIQELRHPILSARTHTFRSGRERIPRRCDS